MSIAQLPGQQFFCRVIINDSEYISQNIISLTIREWVLDVLPRIDLSLFDDGFLSEVFPLEDREEIRVMIGKHEDDENALELTFNLVSYSIDVIGDNKKTAIAMSGYLKADSIFAYKNRVFKRSSSVDIFQRIASETGIKFSNPLNSKTNDIMNWYQTMSNYFFVKHVLERAYNPNDSLFFYANCQNNFVFTSLNREIEKKEGRIAKFSVENFETFAKDDKDKDDTIWFNSYNFVNYSGQYNIESGYTAGYSYYDQKAIKSESYNTLKKLSKLTFRKKDLLNETACWNSYGVWNSNLYSEKFFESTARNRFLREKFFDFSVVINANSLSKISLFDKVNLAIPTMFDEEGINEAMSGEYLVGGIVHNVSSNGIYKKMVSLHRNGMNQSPNIRTTRLSS